tara:strand:- start:151 stop:726 length:576 start_codon:yes stop_codon:yes gene_type:complete
MAELNLAMPEENQAAYEQFVPPKHEEYKIPDLSEIDIDAIALNLNSMEQKQQNNLIIKLLFSLIKSNNKIAQTNQLLVDRLVKTKNYLLSHRYKMLIKIGYSENIEHRLRKHRNNDWTVLATGEGSKEREKAMLKTLKQNGFVPEPSSEEIFTISEELVDLLCANNWVGANENKEFILDKFHQQKIFKNTF